MYGNYKPALSKDSRHDEAKHQNYTRVCLGEVEQERIV